MFEVKVKAVHAVPCDYQGQREDERVSHGREKETEIELYLTRAFFCRRRDGRENIFIVHPLLVPRQLTEPKFGEEKLEYRKALGEEIRPYPEI